MAKRILIAGSLTLMTVACASSQDPDSAPVQGGPGASGGTAGASGSGANAGSSGNPQGGSAGSGGGAGSGGSAGSAGSGGTGAGGSSTGGTSTGGSAGVSGAAGSAGGPSGGAAGAGTAGTGGAATGGVGGSSAGSGGVAGSGGGGAGAVMINEVYVDLDLRGAAFEAVELKATPGTSVTGLSLRHYHPDLTLEFDLQLPAGSVGASGFYVVGGGAAPTPIVDAQFNPFDGWDLDQTGGYVQLYRTSDLTLIDTLGYGTATAQSGPMAPTTIILGSAAPRASIATTADSTARGLGRDSGDNSSDYCVQLESLGASNLTCP